MTNQKLNEMVEAYSRLKNLKLVSTEIGVPWQTVYWWLKKLGINVIGDKSRYGSSSDQLGLIGENEFKRIVPFANSNNDSIFQSKFDFLVGDYTVDIKTSSLLTRKSRSTGIEKLRWMFNLKDKDQTIDFLVCFALNKEDGVDHIFLFPNEIFNGMKTISIAKSKSKYYEYLISEEELTEFFKLVTLNN